MNKSLIRIIKRGIKITPEMSNKSAVALDAVKAASLTKREIVRTITGWVSEQREQNRLAEIAAREMLISASC